jgi:hypothetical protein
MQNKLTSGPLLDFKGELTESGYANSLIKTYNRNAIKASGFRIKEWDYYLIHNERYGVALTIADNSYLSALSVSFIDFENKTYITKSKILPLTFGKLAMPSTSSSGDIEVKRKDAHFSFKHESGGRRLMVRFDEFTDARPFFCDIFLSDAPEDSMVIATPFSDDKKAFYYNQKINCMRAKGSFGFNGSEYHFELQNSVGLLDWGRGVWTYKNTWYWGSASGLVQGKSFGFNIGYGFGDTSSASENMLIYDGAAHKLDQVTFHIPKKEGAEDYLSPWKFTSNDGRFKMDFNPILDRKDLINVGLGSKFTVIKTDQHQVFGYFTGSVILDNEEVLRISDFLGFAEKVENWW